MRRIKVRACCAGAGVLLSRHGTAPVDDLFSISQAENEAHTVMGKRYERINQELFRRLLVRHAVS
ncbi:hypothetical protein ACIGZI_36940 [Streptomyces griseus]|uniref:hypothetical protein n=1 Tax=Streptomyces griseus TaxID=1911 RepID=UPI0037D4F957